MGTTFPNSVPLHPLACADWVKLAMDLRTTFEAPQEPGVTYVERDDAQHWSFTNSSGVITYTKTTFEQHLEETLSDALDSLVLAFKNDLFSSPESSADLVVSRYLAWAKSQDHDFGLLEHIHYPSTIRYYIDLFSKRISLYETNEDTKIHSGESRTKSGDRRRKFDDDKKEWSIRTWERLSSENPVKPDTIIYEDYSFEYEMAFPGTPVPKPDTLRRWRGLK